MEEQNCGNCRFWRHYPDAEPHFDEDGEPYDVGACLRYPPSVPTHHGSLSRIAMTTCDTQWCGEWRSERPPAFDETARALALATLSGDMVAARGLADRVVELDGGD